MGNKLLTQVILIITAIAIVLVWIRPSFTTISTIQDDIARYENTVSRASELNAALQDLVATERSISQRESASLETYLPSEINDVMVMRDIQNIFKLVNIPITTLNSISSESFQANNRSFDSGGNGRIDENAPILAFKDFQLSFFGTYEHLKLVLQGLEVNAYPLEVVELSFIAAQDVEGATADIGLPPGVMKFDIALRAYALPGIE